MLEDERSDFKKLLEMRPLILTTSVGLDLELALVRAGQPFLRIVQHVDRATVQFDYLSSMDLFDDFLEGQTTAEQARRLRSRMQLALDDNRREDLTPARIDELFTEEHYVERLQGKMSPTAPLLIKVFGSIDDRCPILSSDGMTSLTLKAASADFENLELPSLVRKWIRARSPISLGFGCLDPDLAVIRELYLTDRRPGIVGLDEPQEGIATFLESLLAEDGKMLSFSGSRSEQLLKTQEVLHRISEGAEQLKHVARAS